MRMGFAVRWSPAWKFRSQSVVEVAELNLKLTGEPGRCPPGSCWLGTEAAGSPRTLERLVERVKARSG